MAERSGWNFVGVYQCTCLLPQSTRITFERIFTHHTSSHSYILVLMFLRPLGGKLGNDTHTTTLYPLT